MSAYPPDPNLIPPEHRLPPTVGTLGFRGFSGKLPPWAWETQHRLAESGGYVREGRLWLPITTPGPFEVGCAPTRALYPYASDLMGWTTDA